MRIQPAAPDAMTERQRSLYDRMKPAVDTHLKGFISSRDDGALIGPFVPMLRFPEWGEGFWAQTKAMLDTTVLPKPAHEVAILVVGAAYGAQYELYAHERVAEGTSLSERKIAAIVAGQRPTDLDDAESVTYDLASSLVRGGPTPDATYEAARAVLGDEATAEVVFLVGTYCAVCVLLNGFAMPVPNGDV